LFDTIDDLGNNLAKSSKAMKNLGVEKKDWDVRIFYDYYCASYIRNIHHKGYINFISALYFSEQVFPPNRPLCQ
jgi:hypothetical protein